jgi:hypothetical protein
MMSFVSDFVEGRSNYAGATEDMEGYEGLSRTWMEQLTLLSSIIGGFSLAIAVEFLRP